MKKLIYLVLILSLFPDCGLKEEKIEKIIIDGVTHIKNPEKPLKGTVLLDIEKTLEINPYEFEEVGLKGFDFVRDDNGNVILFSSTIVEAQRFNSKGEYLGSLVRKGRGPGEFPDRQFFRACFMNNEIWATGNMKLAKYDRSGQFLDERKIGYYPEIIVNDDTFFIRKDSSIDKFSSVQKIFLVNLSSDKAGEISTIPFFEASNVGWIRIKGGGFWAPWATPGIEFLYDRKNQKVFVTLNTEYKIYVKNLKGETLYIIEKSYTRMKLSSKAKKKLLSLIFRSEPIDPAVLAAFPDKLVAVKDIKILPKGYLAVYRVAAPEVFEIDVFDPEGRYVYILKPPQGISLEKVKFHSRGFAVVTEKEDMLVYVDYKIKNLPDIFQN